MKFARILVPTALTDGSPDALRCARTFAEHFGSRVTLLHASRFAASMYLEHPLGFYLDDAPAPKRALQERLRSLAREHFAPEHQVETLVVDDDPARAIASAAADIDADAIVMTNGATARRVMRMTPRLVLALTPTRPRAARARDRASEPRPFRHRGRTSR